MTVRTDSEAQKCKTSRKNMDTQGTDTPATRSPWLDLPDDAADNEAGASPAPILMLNLSARLNAWLSGGEAGRSGIRWATRCPARLWCDLQADSSSGPDEGEWGMSDDESVIGIVIGYRLASLEWWKTAWTQAADWEERC